jgi:hypothetical protein
MDLVLQAFYRHFVLSLIQVSTSENEIEQTSWCNFNSSDVLHILMIKNRFTFESKVPTKFVSELVISSSPDLTKMSTLPKATTFAPEPYGSQE